MLCVDCSCGKNEYNINNNIKNSFHYITCKECTRKRKINSCQTCLFGIKLNNKRYLCKKDKTYGIFEED